MRRVYMDFFIDKWNSQFQCQVPELPSISKHATEADDKMLVAMVQDDDAFKIIMEMSSNKALALMVFS